MVCCRTLALLALFAGPAAAQTNGSSAPLPAPPVPPASPLPAPPVPTAPPPGLQAATPAPMPDPLVSPDLQAQPARTPSLGTLVQQSAWQDAVVAAARSQLKQLPENCAAASFKPTGELTVYTPPQFDPNGALASGIWSERVVVSGCGAPMTLNILTVLQPGSPPARIPTMPGDTRADPAMQKSALQYAQAIAARAAPPNCREEMFTNTQFDGYTGLPNGDVRDGRQNRAWREIWTLSSCGVNYAIQLTFTPNAQGTQLTATNPVRRP